MPTFDQLWNPGRPHWNLHRSQPRLDRRERRLVCGFLRRYVQWCAKSGHHDRIKGAMDLAAWVNRQPVRPTDFPPIMRRGPVEPLCPTMWTLIGRRRTLGR